MQASEFRERAGLLARYGATESCEALSRAAEDLESNFRAWWLEELTIPEAATETGYSRERLRELVAERRIPGKRDGSVGAIRVRRCDLPSKPAPRPPLTPPLQVVASRLGIK